MPVSIDVVHPLMEVGVEFVTRNESRRAPRATSSNARPSLKYPFDAHISCSLSRPLWMAGQDEAADDRDASPHTHIYGSVPGEQ